MNRYAMLLSACLLGAFGVNAFAEGKHWTYEGEEGPEHWGELAAGFGSCNAGKNQSPVNIERVVAGKLPKLSFSYSTSVTDVVNNGHTVQANFAPGSTVSLGDHVYELKQVHFHTPSENHIKGKEFPLEGHLVHADKDGNLAVVAVMFKQGHIEQGIAKIWKQMPHDAGEKMDFEGKISANELLPKNHAYYYFSGSLTTPPCSEGVAWVVLKNPVGVEKEQVEAFAHVMHHPNNRPVQPLNSRIVVN